MKQSKAQSEFLINYMGHMLLDGDTPENRERIQGFLALQDKDRGADYEIHFLNGKPKDVCLFADSLLDVDIADVYGVTVFEKIHVYLKNGMNWTETLAADFIQDIRDDVEFDGMDAHLDYEFKDDLLMIACDFE